VLAVARGRRAGMLRGVLHRDVARRRVRHQRWRLRALGWVLMLVSAAAFVSVVCGAVLLRRGRGQWRVTPARIPSRERPGPIAHSFRSGCGPRAPMSRGASRRSVLHAAAAGRSRCRRARDGGSDRRARPHGARSARPPRREWCVHGHLRRVARPRERARFAPLIALALVSCAAAGTRRRRGTPVVLAGVLVLTIVSAAVAGGSRSDRRDPSSSCSCSGCLHR
jgi:hypothetical protein